jgi:hypothetical protein
LAFLCIFGFILLLHTVSSAQRIAVIAPIKSQLTDRYSTELAKGFATRLKVLDDALSESGFRSMKLESPFNLSLSESKQLAAVIGADFMLILRTGVQRRLSFSKPDYFEAFAVSYLVSGRTGRLVDWKLNSFEADTAEKAEQRLLESVDGSADEIAKTAIAAKDRELAEKPKAVIEEVPAGDSPGARNFRPPVPYRRIKPEYTRTAFLYDARATVDIEVDIASDGNIMRTEIVRWAGYGLDGSVERAVRAMNWRPAERGGKPLPMRVLLRYNFTKVEEPESD